MWFYYDDFTFIFSGRYVERIKTDQFLLSRPNQLMGCLINKVASSSMMRMYLTLQGLDNKKIESPHGYRLKFVPEVSQQKKTNLIWDKKVLVLDQAHILSSLNFIELPIKGAYDFL